MRVFIIIAALLAFVPAAAAQQVCAPREEIVAQLRHKHNEVKNVEGVVVGGGILEIFSSQTPGDKGRTFTAIITDPNGRTCIVSVGSRWRYVSDKESSI